MITHALAVAATTVTAILGGSAAQYLGFPLPWLLGPLIATAAFCLSGVNILGTRPAFPPVLRQIAIPVIGVMIGSVVPPGILNQLATWWPSLVLVLPFVITAQLLNYAVLRRLGGYDKPTAFFAASPGGLIEAVLIGEARGGNVAMMSVQHLGRVALTVTFVPVIYYFITGHVVGSAAGVGTSGAPLPSLADLGMLLVSGAVGYAIHRVVSFPASILVWPMLLSGLIHATGWTAAAVPPLLVQSAQLVIGATIGLRFLGQTRRQIAKALGLSTVTVMLTLVMAFAMAAAISASGIAERDAVFLAFAPGGLVEMGLIAISLGASPIYVTLHHILRILVAVLMAQKLFDLLVARGER